MVEVVLPLFLINCLLKTNIVVESLVGSWCEVSFLSEGFGCGNVRLEYRDGVVRHQINT